VFGLPVKDFDILPLTAPRADDVMPGRQDKFVTRVALVYAVDLN
jgi:hypothetical protein